MEFQQSVGTVTYPGVGTQFFQVPANQREIMLFIQSSNRTNFGQGSLVANLASQRIAGIRRVGDHTSLSDDIHCVIDQPDLWVLRMDMVILTHTGNW